MEVWQNVAHGNVVEYEGSARLQKRRRAGYPVAGADGTPQAEKAIVVAHNSVATRPDLRFPDLRHRLLDLSRDLGAIR